jgi:hypothetical protein
LWLTALWKFTRSAGGAALNGRETSEMAAVVGQVSGLDLVHLQCHFGLCTLSWARRGARVTGVDFSVAAWMRSAASCLRPGGALVLIDMHPLVQMTDTEGPRLVTGDDGRGRFPVGSQYLPTSYALRARRP